MQTATGVFFILAGLTLAVMFRVFVAGPATTLSSTGEYGELYGPINVLQWAVYFLCLLQVCVGVLTLLIHKG